MSNDRYDPPSVFLQKLIQEEIPLSGSPQADNNLAHLVSLMHDKDDANRDWATMLLAQQYIDTAMVRDALLNASSDESRFVRAEAILGLVSRDKAVAIPLIQRELSNGYATVAVLEAAEIAADPSLAELLRDFSQPSGDKHLDRLVHRAIAACRERSR